METNRIGAQEFGDVVQMMLLYLSRPAVQLQLISVLVVGVASWFASRWLWRRYATHIKSTIYCRLDKKIKLAYLRRGVRVLKHMTYPSLALLLLYGLYGVFRLAGAFSGLVGEFVFIAWLFFAYRLFIALLYASYPDRRVKRYHHRLLTPIFTIIVTVQLLETIISLPRLYNLPLIRFLTDSITLGSLFVATVGLYLWIDALFAIQEGLRNFLLRRTRLQVGSIDAGLTVGRYVVILVGLTIALNALGLDPTTIGFITGGLSVGIGIGLQGIVGNFVSGLILLFEQSLRPGDVIEVDGTMAVVQRLSIRATSVRTYNGVEIIIPNEKLLTSNVTTYTGSDRSVRLIIDVGISYDSDPVKALNLLLEIAKNHPKVLENPAPLVAATEFGDSSIDLVLRAWVSDLQFSVRSELICQIWESFAAHGIEIPFPQRDLHIRSGLPEALTESKAAPNPALAPSGD